MQMWRDRVVSILKVVSFLLALNIFFVAIKLLGAFKDIGSGVGEEMMAELAMRPVLGLLLGILVTSVIQSSSTTTSLVVGLAASGVFGDSPELAMAAAVPLVMGANIGTTVTNTIVSLGHIGDDEEFGRAFAAATVHDVFNFMTVVLLLPLQATTNFLGIISLRVASALEDAGGLRAASPLKLLVKPQVDTIKALFDHEIVVDFVLFAAIIVSVVTAFGFLTKRQHQGREGSLPKVGVIIALSALGVVIKTWHEFIFSKPMGLFICGLFLLLFALWVMVTIMRSVVLDRARTLFGKYVFTTPLRALMVGLLLTVLVQSSSVTTSLVVPLAGAGLVTLVQIFPYSLGANLGTTVTAFLAALSLGDPLALAVAIAHFFFNILGIAIIYPIKFIRNIPLRLAQLLASGAVRWKLLPVVYVLGVYVLVPILLLWLIGEAS